MFRKKMNFLIICTLAVAAISSLVVGGSNAVEDATIGNSKLIELHENNWDLMLKGEWMIEFFAPWCPACKNLAPTWENFANTADDINVNVAKIDVTTSPSLSGRFFVTALPTIYHVKDGEFRQYKGSRDGLALLAYVKDEQWKKIAPISSWKKPNTIHMSVLSYFFKLSHTLKDFNTRLQEEYGVPTWGSYAIFAVGTIFVGAALGLMLVCVVDFLYPPKKTQRLSFSDKVGARNNMSAHDEIEDDIDNSEDDDNNAEESGNDDDDDDDNDEKDEDDKKDEDESSTSEDELNSKSEGEEPESDKAAKGDAVNEQTSIKEQKASSSPSEVRKRSRKAD